MFIIYLISVFILLVTMILIVDALRTWFDYSKYCLNAKKYFETYKDIDKLTCISNPFQMMSNLKMNDLYKNESGDFYAVLDSEVITHISKNKYIPIIIDNKIFIPKDKDQYICMRHLITGRLFS